MPVAMVKYKGSLTRKLGTWKATERKPLKLSSEKKRTARGSF